MTVMLSLAMTPLLLLNFSSWFIACYFILLNCVSVHILQRLTSPPPLLHRLWRQDREDMGRRLPSTARRAERPHEHRDFSCVRREREVLGVRWCGRGLKRVGTCFPAISRMLCRCCDAFKAQCCDWWWRLCYGDNDAICAYECDVIWCYMIQCFTSRCAEFDLICSAFRCLFWNCVSAFAYVLYGIPEAMCSWFLKLWRLCFVLIFKSVKIAMLMMRRCITLACAAWCWWLLFVLVRLFCDRVARRVCHGGVGFNITMLSLRVVIVAIVLKSLCV